MNKLLIGCCCLLMHLAHGQASSPYARFGNITAADLEQKQYGIDPGAPAVVLCDIGKSAIEGNNKGFFSVLYKRHRVVHILNKSAYDEANVEIRLYSNRGNDEKLEKVKAVTYNLENGKVVESKLEKGSIYKEKISDNWQLVKFTFPNVKEGSIIEYEYDVLSDYVDNLDPWEFQCAIPVLWSEYTLSVPQFFSYTFLSHGYQKMFISDRKDRTETFNVNTNTMTAESNEKISFRAGISDFRWVMKDLPEIKIESYASALRNHIASIEFQLSAQHDPLEPRNFMNSWPMLAKDLLEYENFGVQIDKENNWLKDEIGSLVSGNLSQSQKARNIYSFVRDQFSCTGYNSIYASQPLKNVFRAKKGNVADINLLLTAMLRAAGIEADPVLLSTAQHGYALENYPLITRFNYVVTIANCDKQRILLDASHPRLGFGRLLPECYNGHARIINKNADPLYLTADSLQEKKFTFMHIRLDSQSNWVATLNQSPGYYESYRIRESVASTGEEGFFKQAGKMLANEMTIHNGVIDSLHKTDDPVRVQYEFNMGKQEEDIIYLNPMLGEGYKKNPFQSAKRHYPVEMPFTMDETYVLTLEVPPGYVVDELPGQVLAKLDEAGSGYFEYRISQAGSIISLRTILRLNKTFFSSAEYDGLRRFFELVVSKHGASIVLKKKK